MEQTVQEGEQIVFTVTANTGHLIESVIGCAGELVSETYTTGIITEDCSVTITTTPIAFTLPNQGFNGRVFSLLQLPDDSGDVYVTGDFTSYNGIISPGLIRLNSDATVDNTLSTGSGFNGFVENIALANDDSGDIYAVGNFSLYNGNSSSRILRLNSDGTIDTSFFTDEGFTDIRFSTVVMDIAPAADDSGDVYVSGTFSHYNGSASRNLIRLNQDGSMDTAFDVGDGFNAPVTQIHPLSNGSGDIFVTGTFATYNGIPSQRIVRIQNDGTAANYFFNSFGRAVSTVAEAQDGSGKFYLGGLFTDMNDFDSNRIVRLNSNSSIDTSFSIGSGFDAGVRRIVPLADGSIYVSGSFTSYADTPVESFVHIDSDGALIGNLLSGSDFGGVIGNVDLDSLAVDDSGDIFIRGNFATYKGISSNGIIRLASDGSIVQTFSDNSAFDGYVFALSQASDNSGDLYIGGNFKTYNGQPTSNIAKLKNNGSIESSFVVGLGFDDSVNAIAPSQENTQKIYVGGDFNSYNESESLSLIRLNSDGTIDNEFDIGTGFDNGVNALLIATGVEEKLYVGGAFTTYQGSTTGSLLRLNSDGSVDSSFVTGSGIDGEIYTIAHATDGSGDIYVGGVFSSYDDNEAFKLIRINEDGSLDTGFVANTTASSGDVHSILPLTDGSGDIYVGGTLEEYNGNSINAIIRLNNDGSIDESFTTGNGITINPSTTGQVRKIGFAPDESGDIYLVGRFNFYNEVSSINIVRLNSDGTIDSTFASGDGFNEEVFTLEPSTDATGATYFGGGFTGYHDTAAMRIISINADGSVD